MPAQEEIRRLFYKRMGVRKKVTLHYYTTAEAVFLCATLCTAAFSAEFLVPFCLFSKHLL